MNDETFWDSSLAFLFDQLDRFSEMHKQANKNIPNGKNNMKKNERVETQSLRKLSQKEIAELRAKANK